MNNYYEDHLRRVTKLVGYNYLVATLLNTHAAQLEKEKFLPPSNEVLPSNEVKVIIFMKIFMEDVCVG